MIDTSTYPHDPSVEMPKPKHTFDPASIRKRHERRQAILHNREVLPRPKAEDYPTASAFREAIDDWKFSYEVYGKPVRADDEYDYRGAVFGYSRKPTKLEKLQNWWWIRKRRKLRKNGYSAMTAEQKREHGELGGKLFSLREKLGGRKTTESYRPQGSRDPVGYVPDNPKVKSVK